MKKFIIQIVVFTFLCVVVAEAVIRVFNLTIDVPKSYRTKSGIAKYYPNQSGKFQGGSHIWEINKYGHSGKAPGSLDDLIILYGDSYIENFMNPVSCHQNVYLKELLPEYNYFEIARAGCTLIEDLENSKEADSLKPKLEVIYVNDKDFTESIASINKKKEFVKVDLDKNKIVYSNYRESVYKDMLYNFKFAYYLYRNVWLNDGGEKEGQKIEKKEPLPFNEIGKLLDYVNKNYDLKGKIFVFSPDSDKDLVALCSKAGFKTFMLNAPDLKAWQLETDSHWSCHGHNEAAKQVKEFIMHSLAK